MKRGIFPKKMLDEAKKNSEIPALRKALEKAGPGGKPIDGSGVNVKLIDVEAQHRNMAQYVVDAKGDYGGVAPKAKTSSTLLTNRNLADPEQLKEDSAAGLSKWIDETSTGLVKEVTQSLKETLKEEGGPPPVVSISLGATRAKICEGLNHVLNTKDEKGKDHRFSKVREEVFGKNADKLTYIERYQKIVDYVDASLDGNKALDKAMKDYRDITKEAYDKGVNIVVASGNDGNASDKADKELEEGVKMKPGAKFSFLGMSEHVITAAAGKTKGTTGEGQRKDDEVSDFSSPGDGKKWNPFVTAPGEGIYYKGLVMEKPERDGRPRAKPGDFGFGIEDMPLAVEREQVISGTSFATPYVAGTIALMLQANPKLTPADVRNNLKETATDIAKGLRSDGYGMVNPEVAVRRALKWKPAAKKDS
jgi:hypothetical protein